LTDDPSVVLPEGAQLVRTDDAGRPPPVPMIGHVTSSYHSAALGRSIALALVKGGRGRHGETVAAPLQGRTVLARIVPPVFIPNAAAAGDG
jgi:sarcosine oxidase subunit alpha